METSDFVLEEDGDGSVVRVSTGSSVLLVGGWGVRRVVEETESIRDARVEGVEKCRRELLCR